jgi:hypothetical protein
MHMTEEEWRHGVKRTPMMNWLRRRGTDRQFYLAGCAAVRAHWDQLPDQPYRNLIRLVEQYVDGLLSREELSRAHRSAEAAAYEEYLALQNQGLSARRLSRRTAPVFAAVHVSDPGGSWEAAFSAMVAVEGAEGRSAASARQCAILRDVFGNPFQAPPTVDPSWLLWNDAVVPKMAQSIYEERAFERLPILADALEEAGCGNAGLLDHCRQPAGHVRGCWAVDALLGKSGHRPSVIRSAPSAGRPRRGNARSGRRENDSRAVILPMVRPN